MSNQNTTNKKYRKNGHVFSETEIKEVYRVGYHKSSFDGLITTKFMPKFIRYYTCEKCSLDLAEDELSAVFTYKSCAECIMKKVLG